jgi:hypothetical protein
VYGRVINLAAPVETGHPLNHDRVAWWYGLPHLSAGQRLRNIMPGGQYEGTLAGPPGRRPTGRGDVGLSFTASGQSVTAANSATPLSFANSLGFSVAATVVPTAVQDGVVIANVAPGAERWQIRANRSANGLFNGSVFTSGLVLVNSTTTVLSRLNHPTRLMLTYNGATIRLFVNGVQEGSAVATGTPTVGSDVQIGRAVVNAGAQYAGLISDPTAWVGVQDAALDARHALQGYRGSDSPLRYLKNTAYFLPAAPSGGNRRRRVLLGAA